MRTVGIIPCRYKSTRFPGKALADILGKPMMWHVYQQSLKSAVLDDVCVATDDDRIKQACDALGLNVLMTQEGHPTGTDRVAECLSYIAADYYVNIQGDEPMVSPHSINAVAKALTECKDEQVMASNAYTLIHHPADALDTNVVKVVMAADDTAMAYSRQPIPYPKGRHPKYFRQLGLYCFREAGLRFFAGHLPGLVEQAEQVEMLRFLEYGSKVLMVQVEDQGIAVDTKADLERARVLMARVVEPIR